MACRRSPDLSFDTLLSTFDLTCNGQEQDQNTNILANSSLAYKSGNVCLLEPYFPTLLPSKVTLNYSKHVFSSVNCIWPLYDRSDGLKGYIPRPPEAISSFESLFERIPDGLQGTYFVWRAKIKYLSHLETIWALFWGHLRSLEAV